MSSDKLFTIQRVSFFEILNDWQILFAKSGSDNPFLSPIWNQLWAETFHDKWPKVNSVWFGDKLVAVGWFQMGHNLSFFADQFFADYANILVDPEHKQAGDLLLESVFKDNNWKKAILEPLRQDEPATTGFKRVAKSHYSKVEKICANPYVDTRGSYKDFYAGLRKNLRQELRTSSNNLAKKGSWQFIEAKTINKKRFIFKSLVDLHLRRQVGKTGSSIFASEINRAFFDKLLEIETEEFEVNLSSIEIDGKVVSACYSIIIGKVFYYWLPSFDADLRAVSLGKLHINMLIQFCFENEITRFDFMGGDESYKFQWNTKTNDLLRLTLFRTKIALSFYVAKKKLENKARKIKNSSLITKKLWVILSKLKRD